MGLCHAPAIPPPPDAWIVTQQCHYLELGTFVVMERGHTFGVGRLGDVAVRAYHRREAQWVPAQSWVAIPSSCVAPM